MKRRTLVSAGAYSFASSRGVPTVPATALITASAKEKWQKWKDKLESSNYEHKEAEPGGLMDLQDTVGAVAFHETGGVAAGVSRSVLLSLEQEWVLIGLVR
jgi:taspase (threonine aspartase 1)